MTYTPNLNLPLLDSDDEKFSDWSASINKYNTGTDNKSAFERIDEFAGHIYGRSGTLTLAVNDWSDGACSLELAELGEKDAVFITPATKADAELMTAAQFFAEADGCTVTFTVQETPSEEINLKYFIVRGI